jgi:hypothetical protein
MYTASRQTSQATQGIHNNTVTVEYDDLYMPPPPPLSRGLTCQIQTMEDEDYDEEEEDDIINNGAIDECSDIQLCSMRAPPKLKRSNARNVAFFDEEEEDIFTNHKTMESDVSPYANLKTLTLMREVSYTPKKDEDNDESSLH